MSDTPPSPRITVLLATFNGAGFLGAQLESYATQTLPPAALIVSDDGSHDATREIVTEFAASHPDLSVALVDGPHAGASANFLQLLGRVPAGADIIALSDQDDVWLEHKLTRGAKALAGAGSTPALYCSTTFPCDERLKVLAAPHKLTHPPAFRHALVQNIASGNTMMLNRAGLDLVQAALPEAGQLPYHDWWIYQIVSGAGGLVLHDDTPGLLYRQHRANVVGSGYGRRGFLARPLRVLRGRYANASGLHVAALRRSEHRLTGENRALLARFARLRRLPMLRRLNGLSRLGLVRQGPTGTLSLWCAAILGRI